MTHDKLSQLALLAQMIDSAEKSIQSARALLRELIGGRGQEYIAEKAGVLQVSAGGRIIEGVFDGQNMVGSDGKTYPVPANYASKSKLVEGDVLKLTIGEDGSFIYKQISPVARKRVLGMLTQDEKGEHRVIAEGKPYRVLLASLTYFHSSPGDEVTLLLPKDTDATWGAVEHVLKKGDQEKSAGEQRSPDLDIDAEFEGDAKSNGEDDL